MKPYIEGSDQLRNQIRQDLVRDEGIRLSPYRDHLGNLTIGIGRNVSTRPQWISHKTAFDMLDEDIDEAEKAAKRIFLKYSEFTFNQKRALVNMIFQLGEPRFRNFKDTIQAIKEGNWELAITHARDSNWYRDPRLRQRALKVTNLFKEDYEKPSTV